MADLNVNSIGDASGGNTATINSYTPTESNMAGRNRIINGDMQISQAAAGSSITPAASGTSSGNFAVDRFRIAYSQNSKLTAQQNRDSVAPPAGFKNYLGVEVTATATVGATDYFLVGQPIEGYNVSDFGWGTASAAPVTLSFWAYSNTTGTFGGAINNSAYDRAYPFTYTINAANTWEHKTVTLAGDTSGTWLATNGVGLYVWFSLGSGSTRSTTAGTWATGEFYSATGANSLLASTSNYLYITGVQLEAGSVATPFERRQYGQELTLCQRYYYNTMVIRDANSLTAPTNNQVELQGARHQFADVTGYRSHPYKHPVLMRAAPTIVVYNANNGGATGQWYFFNHNGASQNFSGGPAGYKDVVSFNAYTGVSVGTSGMSLQVWAHWSANAEL